MARDAWPYLAALIAALLFAPVLLWNARHGWASFAFQGVRLGEGYPPNIGSFLRFAMYETLWIGPVLLVATLVAGVVLLFAMVGSRRPFDAVVAMAFLFPLAFFFVRSLTLQINQSWAWFVWPIGILALALALPWGRAGRRITGLVVLVVASGAPAVAALHYHAVFDQSVWLGRGDPFGQDAGFGDMADRVLADAGSNGARWIATTDYRTYANLVWHIGRQIPVLLVNQRARFLDFAPRDPALFTGPALYVHFPPVDPVLSAARLTPLEMLPIAWRGVEMQAIAVDRLDGFTPALDPAPDTLAYGWTN